MKKVILILLSGFVFSAFGQYKDSGFQTESIKDGIVTDNYNPLFGFLNSDNFSMSHSYSLSYSSFGNQGLALGVYTNSMMYRFADNLDVQVDASIVHSPYSTLGKNFEKNISGFYISRAAVNYKPWKDVSVSIQYRNLPYYNPYYGYYRSFYNDPFSRNDSFFDR